MSKYNNHIAIVGAGIAGLALGCFLQKYKIKNIVFEKNNSILNEGAGISISPNGIRVIEHLGLKKELIKKAFHNTSASFFSEYDHILTNPVDVFTSTRSNIYEILKTEYLKIGGQILLDSEVTSINKNKSELVLNKKDRYKFKHIVACDGINSSLREKGQKNNNIYSGYSCWRGIIKQNINNINLVMSPKSHTVIYPTAQEGYASFVGVIKKEKGFVDSWREQGTFQDFANDIIIPPDYIEAFKNINLYRWGIYIRKPMKKLYTKNLTFLGDAAHPIVPFLGQGGCLALEDAEAFAYFLKEYPIPKAQKYYNENRIYRVNRISSMSLNQGRLYHLSNRTLINARNRLMQFKFIRDISTSFLWDYDFLNSKLNNFNS